MPSRSHSYKNTLFFCSIKMALLIVSLMHSPIRVVCFSLLPYRLQDLRRLKPNIKMTLSLILSEKSVFPLIMIHDYSLEGRYLFRKSKLPIPEGSLRGALVQDLHGSGLWGHFERDEIFKLVQEWYYLPNINEDVEKFQRCKTCQSFEEQTQMPTYIFPYPFPLFLGKMLSWAYPRHHAELIQFQQLIILQKSLILLCKKILIHRIQQNYFLMKLFIYMVFLNQLHLIETHNLLVVFGEL